MSYVNKVDGYFIRLSNGDYLSVFDLDIVKEKTMEVTKLKELLKECRNVMNIAGYFFGKIENVDKARNLLQQIDEVLNVAKD